MAWNTHGEELPPIAKTYCQTSEAVVGEFPVSDTETVVLMWFYPTGAPARNTSPKQETNVIARDASEQATSSQRFCDFFSLAHDFLSRAAEYDAKGLHPDAVIHYQKGAHRPFYRVKVCAHSSEFYDVNASR